MAERLRLLCLGPFIGLLLAHPAMAQAPEEPTPEWRIEALQRQLADVSMQLKILERRIELEKEQSAERAKTTPQPVAGRGGFSLQSADGQFRVRVRGYLHADSRVFFDDDDRRGTDTFLLRRVRPIVEATMFGIFDVRFMPDFGGGTTTLQDAYVDMRFRPTLNVRAGKFKAPFGFERLMSATEMPFIERAMPTALVPNRDLGVMAHGDLAGGTVTYAAGVFNGVVDGGSGDADTQDGKDVIGRVFFQPFRSRRDSRWQGLGVGIAGSYGEHRGVSATSSALPAFRTAAQTSFFAFRGDDPVLGPVLADGTHGRISAHGHYYSGPFGLIGEHVLSSQNIRRGTNAIAIDNTAWQVAGSWVLTGETPSYRGVVPRSRFDLDANTWGALELTARYTTMHVDRDLFPVFANPNTASPGAHGWTAGVNWFLNTGVKVMVNFERTTFDATGNVRRQPENDLLTRLQFAF